MTATDPISDGGRGAHGPHGWQTPATEDRWTIEDDNTLRWLDGKLCAVLTAADADLFRSALDAEYARRALPDGVELHRDGSLWALGRDIPDGWERRIVNGWLSGNRAALPHGWYEVRPPQTPPTVRVPWWEALRDRRTEPSGHAITSGGPGATGAWAWVRSRPAPWPATFADADGTVEVLA